MVFFNIPDSSIEKKSASKGKKNEVDLEKSFILKIAIKTFASCPIRYLFHDAQITKVKEKFLW